MRGGVSGARTAVLTLNHLKNQVGIEPRLR